MTVHDNRAYEVTTGDECWKREPTAEDAAVATAKYDAAMSAGCLVESADKAEDGRPGGSETAEIDPWAMPEFAVQTTPWRELDCRGKFKRVAWDYSFRQVAILGFLYMFICSLDFLSSSFRLVGGKAISEVFSDSEILSNPVTGVMIGVLATVLLQSSSTTTSIVVAMVGSDSITVKLAIPIIMGANIGTSVTNTLVSFGQVKRRDDFRRAFGGATVHDMFNWLTVVVLLPVEAATGYLLIASNFTIESFQFERNKDADLKLLSVITDPLTKRVIQLDKNNLVKIATCKNCTGIVLAQLCPYKNETVDNVTVSKKTCEYLFDSVAGEWDDEVIGAILLTVSIVLLCACLVGLVKILQSTLKGTVAKVLKKVVNTNIPSPAGAYLTGYIYVLLGTLFTILVQSSSIFTSALTPLVGLGVLPIERAYALTLGSNVGTTATAILAALAGNNLEKTLQIALCHLYFNISGIVLWYVVPQLRFPIPLAKGLGNITAKYRWFSVAYLVGMFFLLPLAVFALSIPGWYVLVGVCGPIVLVLVVAAVINLIQKKRPHVLPARLRTWDFLPLALHSLKPMDRLIQRCCCSRCRTDEVESGTNGDVEAVTKDMEMRETSMPSSVQGTPPPSYNELA